MRVVFALANAVQSFATFLFCGYFIIFLMLLVPTIFLASPDRRNWTLVGEGFVGLVVLALVMGLCQTIKDKISYRAAASQYRLFRRH